LSRNDSVSGLVARVRVHEQLRGQRQRPLPGEQRDHGGEVAARAVAPDGDPAGIGTELVRVVDDPRHRRDAVVHRRGERMLRREPVARSDDETAGGVGERTAHPVGRVDPAQRPAATEEVHQRPQWTIRRRPVDPHRPFVVRAGEHAVGDLRDRLGVAATGTDVREIGRTRLGEGHLVQRGGAAFHALVTHRGDERVKRHRDPRWSPG
jgi:hypothetical protein